MNEKDGTWGAGVDVQLPPDAATTSDVNGEGPGGVATVVSCASAGNCTAGGTYAVRVGDLNEPAGWAATEQAGQWGQAVGVQLPGGGAAGDHFGTGLSCPSVGNCTGGRRLHGPKRQGARGDRAGAPRRLVARDPGAGASRGGSAPNEPNAFDDPLFCCLVRGRERLRRNRRVRELPALRRVPGHVPRLAPDRAARRLERVQGRPAAEHQGTRRDASDLGQLWRHAAAALQSATTALTFAHAIIEIERRGKWRRAISPAVPANAAKSLFLPGLNSVSCPSAHRCTIVGSYADRSGKPRGLIVNLQIP